MKTNIKDFFKNIRNEYSIYDDLLRSRDEIKTKYYSDLQKLNTKKEKLWIGREYTKWELNDNDNIDRSLLLSDKNYAFGKMCSKETINLNNINNKLGYYNKILIDELKRLINSHVKRYIDQIKKFSNELYPTLTDVNIKDFLFYFILIVIFSF
jgi:hypothetical protein